MNERIAAAAIRMNGVVFTGIRHHLIIHDMVHTGFCTQVHGEQGFITTTGRFVDRHDALVIAHNADQIKHPLLHRPAQLFSEELWEDYGKGVIV